MIPDLSLDALASLAPEELAALQAYLAPQIGAQQALQHDLDDPADWMERNFWIPDLMTPDDPNPHKGLIVLMPHLKTLLRYIFDPQRPLVDSFSTIVYSTIKKSAKTSISAAVGRWIAEKKGPYSDVIFCANDREQAKGRAYEYAVRSLALDPRWDHRRDELVTATHPTANPEWYTSQMGAFFHDGGKLRAISRDYAGEAGSNSNAAIMTEIAFFREERARRLWDELRPPPTRWAIRWAEGYAGYLGEGNLWKELWELFRDINDPEITLSGARRVTWEELEPHGGWVDWEGNPFYNIPGDPTSGREQPPLWVNEAARAVGYIDQGVPARRMPWQLGEQGRSYYSSLEITERQESIQRLDHNFWASPVSEFIPIEQWEACRLNRASDTRVAGKRGDFPIDDKGRFLIPSLDEHTPIVVGVDASVTGDCTALVAVARAPWAPNTEIIVHSCRVWVPPDTKRSGKKVGLDYHTTINRALRQMSTQFNVICIVFDPYQMHSSMMDIMRGRTVRDPDSDDMDGDEAIPVWCYPFSQAALRNQADKCLYDLIMQRRIWHSDFPDLTAHMRNAAAKQAKDEDTRLRIVKSAPASRIDSVVALSMASYQCLHLNLS